MTDEPQVEQLENRIDTLESKIEKMMPSRRDALKMGGAALAGGSLMAGTASADTVDDQVGTIGGPNQEVDLVSEDIDNSNQITTKDLVVNGTATGPFGGGAPVLESGDTFTVESLDLDPGNEIFKQLYSGTAKDVIGGTVVARAHIDFLYEFSDNQTITKNTGLGATTYSRGNISDGRDQEGDEIEIDFLPPAKDVIRIEVGAATFGIGTMGADVYLKG